MAADAQTRPVAVGASGPRAALESVRRALPAVLGVFAVVAVHAATRSGASPTPAMFVAYSVLIWAAIPAVPALAVALVAGLVRDAALSRWVSAALVGLATSIWVAWGIDGLGSLQSVAYGLLYGVVGAGAGAALAAWSPWSSGRFQRTAQAPT